MHRPVDPRPDFPALEQGILNWWNEHGIQRRALTAREGAEPWIFYEGPPYANAPPGVHNVLPRVIKDLYTRYQTMKGRFVPRKGGWDCHGLPAEVEVEKKLGIKHKREIVDYGIERFNHLCRAAVSGYITNYVRFSDRIGFWLDYENAYETMSNEYIESVWWSLAEFHKKGLLFESERVAAYCPRCETPLSDHELGQEDVYREVSDPGITVAFPVVDGRGALEGAEFAAWTTTPWTLIAHLALAVNPEITYVLVAHEGRRLIVARDRLKEALGREDEPTPIATFPGRDLIGTSYRPPFEYARRFFDRAHPEATLRAWRVIPGDFVNVEEGTGIVHTAGAFGADDLNAVRAAGIPVYNPVDQSGNFDASVPEFEGVFVKAADDRITEMLRSAGVLIRADRISHRVAHCWRCDTQLLNYALIAWYIRTTAFKDDMLAENANVNWIPEHIRDGRYGDWLRNNVDWSLSRFRFWGTPLPIWRCPNKHDRAIGSVAELSELAGRDLSGLELHRPYVDDVTFVCPDCGDTAKRVPDVIDVWYDSGAMPFAQWGYPHKGTAEFEAHFPAQFIAEGLDQTRGWFYSLMAESVGLFGRNAYEAVICHGLILDEDGKKMSKHKAIADPWTVFDTFGSDALRFFFLSAGDPSANRRLTEDALRQVVRGPFLTLWNVYRLYVLYANIDGFDPNSWPPAAPRLRPPLDRWLLSELHSLIFEVDEALSNYDSLTATRRIAEFIDDLSNWYVRRSRERFWKSAQGAEAEADKSAAYWTLWTTLVELSGLLAPFAPFLAEELYRNLVIEVNPNATASVHLTDFPSGDPEIVDPRLAAGMASARELASLGHSARRSAGVKVRQALRQAVLLVPWDLRDAVEEVADLLADELNVKELAFAEEASELVRTTLRPNFAAAGPAFGPRVRALQNALQRLGADEAGEIASRLEHGMEIELAVEDGEPLVVGPEHVDIRREPAENTAFAYEPPFGVSLDLEITDELRREGIAREFVHQVQNARRDSGLDVTDRISLAVAGPPPTIEALQEHEDYICDEVLATSISYAEGGGAEGWSRVHVDDAELAVHITKSA
jgi:isoleucyl-tRNA synthetase